MQREILYSLIITIWFSLFQIKSCRMLIHLLIYYMNWTFSDYLDIFMKSTIFFIGVLLLFYTKPMEPEEIVEKGNVTITRPDNTIKID